MGRRSGLGAPFYLNDMPPTLQTLIHEVLDHLDHAEPTAILTVGPGGVLMGDTSGLTPQQLAGIERIVKMMGLFDPRPIDIIYDPLNDKFIGMEAIPEGLRAQIERDLRAKLHQHGPFPSDRGHGGGHGGGHEGGGHH